MRVFALGLLLLVALPDRAHAWVDATVRSASAQVSIDEHAHAHVAIDATLRIDGGWLEALEIDGLDPGLTLDPADPVTMTTQPTPDERAAGEAPEPLEPTVTLRDDGVLVLSFPRRRSSPRRGEYLVHLAYDASVADRAALADDGAHVHWTFPAWRHGLDSVVVALTLPPGAEPVLAEEDEIASESALVDGALRLDAHLEPTSRARASGRSRSACRTACSTPASPRAHRSQSRARSPRASRARPWRLGRVGSRSRSRAWWSRCARQGDALPASATSASRSSLS